MKKLMTLLLGLSFALGTSMMFAQNQPKDDTKMEKKSKKKGKKKMEKKEDKKEGTR